LYNNKQEVTYNIQAKVRDAIKKQLQFAGHWSWPDQLITNDAM
jgi:hypothetical protein